MEEVEKEVESVVTRTVTRILIPFIQLFGIYVIIHGKFSPGGGFQGGVILGTSMILYAVVFSLRASKRRASKRLLLALMSLGVLTFAGTGVVGMLFGNYLEYDRIPLLSPAEVSALSILVVEVGIGITVMAVMILLFLLIATGRSDARVDRW